MKAYLRQLVYLLSACFFIFNALQAASFPCKGSALVRLEEVADGAVDFYKRLSDDIRDPVLRDYYKNHPRWGNISPDEDILFQVQLDMEASLGQAINRSVDDIADPMKIRALAAEAYAEVLLLSRVLDSDISLEDIADGLGEIAKRIPDDVSDQKLADTLLKNKDVFLNPNRPYREAGYSEAQMLRDAKTLLDGDNGIAATKFFRNDLPAGNSGKPYELRVAAARKEKGENVIALSADDELGIIKGADVLTDDAAYNIGLTTTTIKGKLTPDKLEGIAKAIIEANDELNVPYKFCVTDGNINDLRPEFDALNAELIRQNSSIQLDVETDIIFESLSL